MKKRDRYWKTGKLYLAAYLFAKGATLVGIEVCGDEVVFAFLDSPEREQWFEEFNGGKPLIDARFYAYALQQLQRQANEALMEFHGQN